MVSPRTVGFDLFGTAVVEAVPDDLDPDREVRSNISPDADAGKIFIVPAELKADEMAAFDRLPRRYQKWLDQDAPDKYSALQLLDMLMKGYDLK